MNLAKSIKSPLIFTLIFLNIGFSALMIGQFNLKSIYSGINDVPSSNERVESSEIKLSAIASPQNIITGDLGERNGKIFHNVTTTNLNCYINRDNPSLSNQPTLFLQDWNITDANMMFSNITAINYTMDLEPESSEFYFSDKNNPTYVYQKFSVETSQYINNISIFMQDINDQNVYNENNSWEVAIYNCSNDFMGTPDESGELGKLSKPHPLNFAAHWDVFDFNNSGSGPVFLNASRTNWTEVNGVKKYWFAFRVKIPPEDVGPKFLYFNPDGGEEEFKGVGDTFKKYTYATYDNCSINNVTSFLNDSSSMAGYTLKGNLSSFKEMDEDRHVATPKTNNLTLSFNFTLANLSYGWSYADLYDFVATNASTLLNWYMFHYMWLYTLDIYLAINVSDSTGLNYTNVRIMNWTSGEWYDIAGMFNITQEEESLQHYRIFDPSQKLVFLRDFIQNSTNNVSILFYYNTTTDFNVSINQATFKVFELHNLPPIQRHDPIISELYYPRNDIQTNGTTHYGLQSLETLKYNDNSFYWAQADTDNLSIEFKFNLLEYLNTSDWDMDIYDWMYLYPDPRLPRMDFRVSSNVSIENPNNLTIAVLELYKGDAELGNVGFGYEDVDWLPLSEIMALASKDENTTVDVLSAEYTWIFLQVMNSSDQNSIRLRFRYQGVSGFENFNVSIDELSLVVYVENAVSSDITSRIGFGLDSTTLKPSDIKMKNNGINVSDNWVWSSTIANGVPFQGYYEFNITSIWPMVQFDVQGNYTIEKSQIFDLNYGLGIDYEKILWNVSATLDYYDYYQKITGSNGLQFNVPSDWIVMNVYNSTISPVQPLGGWYWVNISQGNMKQLSVYNISDGHWKIQMNSTISAMNVAHSITSNVIIDQTITTTVSIPGHYGGNLYFKVYDSDNAKIYSKNIELNESALENSSIFTWDIFSTTQTAGTYSLKSYWIKNNETHGFLALDTTTITVSKHEVKLEILGITSFKNNSIQGEKILIRGKLTISGTTTAIVGETIYIKIDDGNGNNLATLSDITNDLGEIQIEYTLPTVSAISIKLSYNSTTSSYAQVDSLQTLEITLISQTQSFINFILEILPFLIAIIIGIVVVIGVKRHRMGKLREKWSGEALILDDLLKISYIMVILKDVGVSIYNKQIALEDLDADLISGFLHAISQFRSELKKGADKASTGKGFKMDYYDSKIVIMDGEFIRVALILDKDPSQKLNESQEAFTKEFEKRFHGKLENFDGDITPYRNLDDLIEKHFNITLMYPLQLSRLKKGIKLEPLEKALVEVAEQMQKERKFFFVSSLLSYGLAGRKESRDQLISAILSLKKRNLLIPIKMD